MTSSAMFGIVAAVAIALQRFNESAIGANRLYDQGQYRQAEERYGEALSLAVSLGDRCHPVALVQNNLAALHFRLGRYREARASWESALQTWEQLGRKSDQASVLSNLAELAVAQARPLDGLALAKKALDIQRDLGIEKVNTQVVYANALRITGRPKESATMLKKILSDKRKSPEPRSRASILTALVQVDLALGNFAEALSEAHAAIADAEQSDGRGSYTYVFAVFLRSRAHQGMGDWTAAERDVREALQVHEQTVGPDHPRSVALLADLAELKGRRGKHLEALGDLDRAIRIHRRHFGERHADYAALLLSSGHRTRALGEKDSALALYQRALDSASAIFDKADPALGPYFNGYAAALFDMGQLADSERYVREAIAVFQSTGGTIHPGAGESYRSLAAILVRQEKWAEAKTMFESCLTVQQHFHGESHESLLDPLVEYAEVLQRLGDGKRARKILAKAAAIEATLPERRHSVSVEGLRSFR